MQAIALLQSLKEQGFSVRVDGDLLYISPSERISDDLRNEIRARKGELLALLTEYERNEESHILPEGEALAAELDRLCRLGDRLGRGGIKAIKCGKTGKRCTACAGIPCFGSQPWEDG